MSQIDYSKPYLKRLILSFFRYSLVFNPEDIKQLTWNDQQSLLESTLSHPLLKTYPVNKEFARLFLKKIITNLETESEVHDDLYMHLCTAMNNEESIKNNFCFRHYIMDDDLSKIVTMKETNNLVVNGTTGMRTWEAAILLADWAISNKKLFFGKNVLELGSGIGFTGIAIAKQCEIKSLYLTDCHEDVVQTICENIEINLPSMNKTFSEDVTIYKSENKITGVMELDWNVFSSLPGNFVPDIVIGADIVYDPSILQPLCNVFKKLRMLNADVNIYIASVIRNEQTHKLFLNTLDELGYYHKVIAFDEPIHFYWNHSICKCLFEIKRK